MKYKFIRKQTAGFLMASFFTSVTAAFCCPGTALAFDPNALTNVASDRIDWPSILELKEQEEDSDTVFLKETLPNWHLPLDDEDQTAFLQFFPLSLESGSFFLNQVNGFPKQSALYAEPDVQYQNGQFILRGSWKELEKEISDRLSDFQGDWSVYIKNLTTGQIISINDHSMESASLIKLFIAGATYELIEQGKLEETDEILRALNQMITVSDNESSNVLVRAMYEEGETFQDGLAVVNDFIKRHGFSDTEQINGIADPNLWVSDGRVNMTSASDCGELLEMIYRGELVSHFSSFRFEVLLNKQEVNYKIPDGLPKGVHISHKTGEVEDTENDAAIIYTPYGDYIFCILSTDLTNTNAAVDQIHEITRLVYHYFAEDITISDTPYK